MFSFFLLYAAFRLNAGCRILVPNLGRYHCLWHWIVAGTIAAGSALAWTLIGLLPAIVGSISLYQAIGDVKIA
jgi:hypothetical protein